MVLQSEKEFNLMQNSNKETIKVQVVKGPLIICRGWDFRNDLDKTSFKTDGKIEIDNSLVEIEEIDMTPFLSKPIYKVTVFRRPQN